VTAPAPKSELPIDTIIEGDCLEVMKDWPDNCVDAVVTDPPFKLGQEYSSNPDPDNLLAVSLLLLAAPEMLRVSKAGAVCVLFYDTRILPFGVEAMRRAGWIYLRGLTLYRRWGRAQRLAGWMSTSDFALVYTKPGAKARFNGPCRHDVYVKAGPEEKSFAHPAQKPLEFVAHIIENVCPAHGLVFDPFIGSGTTAEAAIIEGRHFIGIDNQGKYVEIARRRVADAQNALFAETNT